LTVTAALAGGAPIKLTDLQGRSMLVEIVSCDASAVRVVRQPDQQTFTIPLDRLDAPSRKAVDDQLKAGANAAEAFEITVDTGKNRKKAGGEDFDDKRVNLSPKITVKNLNLKSDTQAAKVTAVFFGRPVQANSDYYVFRSQSFDLPTLQPGGSHLLTVEEISQAYDNRGYAQFGARYAGYAVLVHSADGKTIYSVHSVPENFGQTFGQKLLTLQTGRTYNGQLNAK
jgi:hypothetical protein